MVGLLLCSRPVKDALRPAGAVARKMGHSLLLLRAPHVARAKGRGRKDGGDRTEAWRAAALLLYSMDFPLRFRHAAPELEAEAGSRHDVAPPIVAVFAADAAPALSATGEAITLVGLAEAAGSGRLGKSDQGYRLAGR